MSLAKNTIMIQLTALLEQLCCTFPFCTCQFNLEQKIHVKLPTVYMTSFQAIIIIVCIYIHVYYVAIANVTVQHYIHGYIANSLIKACMYIAQQKQPLINQFCVIVLLLCLCQLRTYVIQIMESNKRMLSTTCLQVCYSTILYSSELKNYHYFD